MTILSRLHHSGYQIKRHFGFRISNHLTIGEVNTILREGEYNESFNFSPVKGFEFNHLGSNDPSEDFHQEAKCIKTPGFLFGIFDGHGGLLNSHAVSERLFEYIAAAVMPDYALNNYIAGSKDDLIHYYNPRKIDVNLYRDVYTRSFHKYLERLSDWKSRTKCNCAHGALEFAFTNLDDDISEEALDYPKGSLTQADKIKHNQMLSVALNGCVACVAHISGKTLHLASLGDCGAVIGTLNENNTIESKKLINEHSFENFNEVTRIRSEHPECEHDTIFQAERLFGNLAPLRAFGDFRYKWSHAVLNERLRKVGLKAPPIRNYLTPPYLSSRPDVVQYNLTAKDKFLIIASDGLWDVLTPRQAVDIVAKHMSDRQFFSPIAIPTNLSLGNAKELFKDNMEAVKTKPEDVNAATYLLRNALGGLERGEIQENYLKLMLSIPAKDSRAFRDDISITVIYFNSDYIEMDG